MMEITIVAHVQVEGQSEAVVDLAIPELIDYELARDFQVKSVLKKLGYTNIAPKPTEDLDLYTATAQLNGQAISAKIYFRKALKSGTLGSKSGISFFELNELKQVVNH